MNQFRGSVTADGEDRAIQGLRRPHLVWVHMASPDISLGVTTRFEITRELREMGWGVTLVLEGEPGLRTIRGMEVLFISKPKVYFLGNCIFHLRFLRLIAQQWDTIDVTLAHQASLPWLLVLPVVRRLRGDRRPLVVMDTRDLNPVRADFKTRLRNTYYQLAHWLANRWADGQTVITRRMAELVKVPTEQLWGIWPSGVHLEPFAAARARRQWPVEGEPIRLVYVGILLRERNLLPLCQAVERANADGMQFDLSLVGRGPDRPYIEELEAFATTTENRVRVLPPVPQQSVPKVLAEGHIGVTSLPPADDLKYQASSPIKLFEYMAAGLPVLATKNACHVEVVGDADYAFWAEDAAEHGLLEALRTIWHARGSLAGMGQRAAVAADDWTWRASAVKLASALQRGMAMVG